ncbi:MAG TPA: pilin [Patescibacteria group bacterium]|jgi:cytochrome bd-type quinol oxidase subunit 2|nr:pilin [Patescibacteria group bacterium]
MTTETKTKTKQYNFAPKIFGALVGLIVIAAVIIIATHAPHALAQSAPANGDAGGFVPCGNEATNPCQIGHLFSTFVVIVNYLIAMAGFIAVIAIVYAGFLMVYSQGEERLREAKGRLSGAVMGLVLVAAAFVLINALFTGSLSIGVKQGGDVLSSPLEYIKNGPGN